MKKPVDIEKAKQNYLSFMDRKKVLTISLIDEEGRPFLSYAPFVKNGENIYIYISQIADHYRYMESNEFSEIMLLADESETANKFAAERVRLRCTAKNIGNDGNDAIFELFNEAHGKATLDLLRTLDFSLFELTPVEGRYVVGFGMAFDIDLPANKFAHVVVDKKK